MSVAFKIDTEFEVELARLFTVLNDVSSWAVFEKPRVMSTKNGQLTLAFDDRTRAILSFELVEGAVKLRVVHELLKDASEIKPREQYWFEVLAGVRRRLEAS